MLEIDSLLVSMLILVISNNLPIAFWPQQAFWEICNLLVMLPSILPKYFTKIDGINLSLSIDGYISRS